MLQQIVCFMMLRVICWTFRFPPSSHSFCQNTCCLFHTPISPRPPLIFSPTHLVPLMTPLPRHQPSCQMATTCPGLTPTIGSLNSTITLHSLHQLRQLLGRPRRYKNLWTHSLASPPMTIRPPTGFILCLTCIPTFSGSFASNSCGNVRCIQWKSEV